MGYMTPIRAIREALRHKIWAPCDNRGVAYFKTITLSISLAFENVRKLNPTNDVRYVFQRVTMIWITKHLLSDCEEWININKAYTHALPFLPERDLDRAYPNVHKCSFSWYSTRYLPSNSTMMQTTLILLCRDVVVWSRLCLSKAFSQSSKIAR